jgi:tetratricopeptide (TPR) repeat protein
MEIAGVWLPHVDTRIPMRTRPPAHRGILWGAVSVLLVLLAAGVLYVTRHNLPATDTVWSAFVENRSYPSLSVLYPLNDTIFPPEIVPPTFRWRDESSRADTWMIAFRFEDGERLAFMAPQPQWAPSARDWDRIKQGSREKAVGVLILGFQQRQPQAILSSASLKIRTSNDPVGAPIFYREVNLPFIEAVKDPSRIRWRFGSIDGPQPRVVLQNLPVCGNCHSFSREGGLLGMDVDYANDKGSYVITRVAPQMSLATSDIITWSDYRREDGQQTFGFLSQVSPDGDRVISTVKDKSVFVSLPPLAFSQLFFPIQGILVVYQLSTKTFAPLPGADDPAFVQSNPCWSPDGKYVVFARAPAYQLRNTNSVGKVLLTPEDCAEFSQDGKPFKFDLYRIPYNEGRGGTPEPLKGASRNGKSNFFARYSPDGKWIVFCQAGNYMLLQPDSELFIIPAEGGEARRLQANTARMNSWHSWSPNNRWLVFSSKANTDYTQLFLTHIDADGNSSPPVVLDHFTEADRAANIPEFVNVPPNRIVRIEEKFINDLSQARAAYVLERTGDIDGAIKKYQEALAINPKNVHAHQRLGFLLFNMKKQTQPGLEHTLEALKLDPSDGCAHYDMGMALMYLGKLDEAAHHLAEAVRVMPAGFGFDYSPARMYLSLGVAQLLQETYSQAEISLAKAVALAPTNASAHYHLSIAAVNQGKAAESITHYERAIALNPQIDDSPELHLMLGDYFAQQGNFAEAVRFTQKAHALAKAAQQSELAQAITERLENYRSRSK